MVKTNRFTLDNGLHVVHLEDKTSQTVTLNTVFDVGSKDEDPEHTGFAHLFEHLMFSGSVNVDDYDGVLQKAGAYNNAYTTQDLTNYYVVLPAVNAEVGFWVESDRMMSLAFNEKGLEVQREVVSEEFKERTSNKPYGDAYHYLFAMMYPAEHTYSWPTIGKEIKHIQDATMQDVKDFFFSHYAPNNAYLAVVGNISLDEVKRLVEKYYGDIPSRDVKKRKMVEIPEQTAERRKVVSGDVPNDKLYMVFRSPSRLDDDYYASDILSDVLSNGMSSRMYKRLVVEKKIFSSIDACIRGSLEDGAFYVIGVPNDGFTRDEVENAIWDELEMLKKESVEKLELEKVVNKYEATQILSDLSEAAKAERLGYYEMIDAPDLVNTDFDNYAKVTPAELRDTAKKIFRHENCCLLWYMKNDSDRG